MYWVDIFFRSKWEEKFYLGYHVNASIKTYILQWTVEILLSFQKISLEKMHIDMIQLLGSSKCNILILLVYIYMNQVLDVENFFFRETTGEESYLIPVGGSNTIGVFGFLTVFDDIQSSVSSLHLFKE